MAPPGLNVFPEAGSDRVKICLSILFYYLQITWSRREDKVRPYSLLTIGDENYTEDKRFLVVTAEKGLTEVNISRSIHYNLNIIQTRTK